MPVVDSALAEAIKELRAEPASGGRGISDWEITKVAEDIANAYLERGASLVEGIAKVAVAKNLAPNFIDRIVEQVNRETYHGLLKRAKPEERATVIFPMAKKAAVQERVSDIGAGPALQVKTAADSFHSGLSGGFDVELDFMAPPPAHMMREPEAGMSKTAAALLAEPAELPDHPNVARRAFEKLASAEQEAGSLVMGAQMEKEASAKKFVKIAKGMLIERDFDGVRQIHRDAHHMGVQKLARDLIEEAFDQATREIPGVKLGTAVDDEYLPDNFPGKVINGDQIVLKLLRHVDNRSNCVGGYMRDIDELDHTRERLTVRVLDLSS